MNGSMAHLAAYAIGGAVAFIVLMAMIARLYRKVGPNEAMLVYGFGGTKVVRGGGRLVIPMLQSTEKLSLELMSFDVAPKKELFTHQGVAVLIDAVTQLKVRSDDQSIRTAAEQFLDKTPETREAAIRLVMEGHLRGIVGQLTVEQIVKEPEMVGEKVRKTCAEDLSKMGLEMISFTIKEVRDQNEYIASMGRPEIERIRMTANIAAAEAQRETEIKIAEAMRAAAVAKAMADQERVIAETASASKQAEAQRDLEIKKAQYAEVVHRQRAQADKAYEIQAQIMQQQIVAEKTKAEQIERTAQIAVQEAEIQRREKELVAQQIKPAEAEATRVRLAAQVEKERVAIRAQGEAEATRSAADAEAAKIRVEGTARAEVLRLEGEAEAQAMEKRAEAYRGYTQAAVLDKVIGQLPEIVRAITAPLAKVDKITLISSGDGPNGTAGASKLTGDVTKILSQLPAVVETLSGVNLGELLKALPQIGDAIRKAEKPSGEGGGGAKPATVAAPKVAPPAPPVG